MDIKKMLFLYSVQPFLKTVLFLKPIVKIDIYNMIYTLTVFLIGIKKNRGRRSAV